MVLSNQTTVRHQMTTVYIARIGWGTKPPPNDNQQIVSSVEEIRQEYPKFIEDKTQIDNKLYCFLIDCEYRNALEMFEQAIVDGHATVEQDGNCEGWGISLESMEQAVQLAQDTADRYLAKRQAERNKETIKLGKIRHKLLKLTPEQRNVPVFLFFKQDYDYRGLDGTYKATVLLGELADYMYQVLGSQEVNRSDEIVKQMSTKYGFDRNFEYSLSEIAHEQHELVAKLLKGKTVSAADEIGYEALSTQSEKQAKDTVKKLLLKFSDLDD